MIVTIIREDNCVLVDRENVGPIDCSALPSFVRAVQWDGEQGWLEVTEGPNIRIVDFSPYQFLVDAWNRTKAEVEAAAESPDTAAEQSMPSHRRRSALQSRRRK